MESDVRHCSRRIAEEERLAAETGSPEVAEKHLQLAMLYKAQLQVLELRLRSSPSRVAG
jgi:hypothetical protein